MLTGFTSVGVTVSTTYMPIRVATADGELAKVLRQTHFLSQPPPKLGIDTTHHCPDAEDLVCRPVS